MAGVCSTAAHHPLLGEGELDGGGSLLDEAPIDVDEAPRQSDLLPVGEDAPAQSADGDGSQSRDSFRDDIADDLKALAPRAVQARLIERKQPRRRSCATDGEHPYASALTLGVLEALWNGVNSIFDRTDAAVVQAFSPFAFKVLRTESGVSKLVAFVIAVIDARRIAGTLKTQGLMRLGDRLRVAKNRLRAELAKLAADPLRREAEAARLEQQLVYDIDLVFALNTDQSPRYSGPA